MKRIFFVFALAIAVFAVNAQEPLCPSWLDFRIPHKSGVGKGNHLDLELVLHNSSQNLYGFYVQISKDILAQWIIVDEENDKYFTVAGCGKNILARLEGVTDEEREANLEQYCVVWSGLRENGDLGILMTLSSSECHFFPASDDGIVIGRIAIDVSNFENGYHQWVLSAPDYNPNKYSFSYTGGVEGECTLASDHPLQCDIYKYGEYASFHYIDESYDAIDEVDAEKKATSVKYYNLSGVESAEPQLGMNIKVTTYSDGSRKSEKVMK